MHTAKHHSSYPFSEWEYSPVKAETLQLTEREREREREKEKERELFLVSMWIQLHFNLDHKKEHYCPFFKSHLFKRDTSCQNQVSNSRVLKVSVLKSLPIPPLGGTLSRSDTLTFDVCFPGSKPLTAQYFLSLQFKIQMYPYSLQHVGSHMRPFATEKHQYFNLELPVFFLRNLLLPWFFTLVYTDRLLME